MKFLVAIIVLLMSSFSYAELTIPASAEVISADINLEVKGLASELNEANDGLNIFIGKKADAEKALEELSLLEAILNGDISEDDAKDILFEEVMCCHPACGGCFMSESDEDITDDITLQ